MQIVSGMSYAWLWCEQGQEPQIAPIILTCFQVPFLELTNNTNMNHKKSALL